MTADLHRRPPRRSGRQPTTRRRDPRVLLATVRGDVAESHDLFARAASILRTTHDDRLPIFLFDLGVCEFMVGNHDRLAELCAEVERSPVDGHHDVHTARTGLLHGLLAYATGDVDEAVEHTTSSLDLMRTNDLLGPRSDPLRFLCQFGAATERWDVAERAALEFEQLIARTGEIACLPVVAFVRASTSFAGGSLDGAKARIVVGLEVIRRPETLAFLDDALLVGAQVALADDRPDQAARFLDERDRRIVCRRIHDPAPVARQVRLARDCVGDAEPAPLALPDWRAVVDHLDRVVAT